MRIVMVGGAGHVGRLIGPRLAEIADVIVADRAIEEPIQWGEQAVVDVGERGSLREALAGADVLLYLAMGTKHEWGSEGWAESQFAVNVYGLYNALEAAAECGLRRAIVAGSMSVYDQFLDLPQGALPDATDAYGLSKRLGEEVGRAAAARHDMDVTVLRLVLPVSDDEWAANVDDKHASVMTSGTDTASAFVAALQHQPHGFLALTISGDLTSRRVDWKLANQHLGWQPTFTRAP